MTRILIFLGAIAITSFLSCKGDYTCSCTYGNGYNGEYYRSADVATYHDVTKSSARKKCNSEEDAHWARYGAPKDCLIICSLK